ncbi:DUF3822 family protein [Nonlabens sp. YIK11]|uniref:DUF3822 family protein n=1 Tax=Nonlabens sp. YIK11 TaxID=1453349 RepID=UPI0006DD1B4C|nr:DUF3822 family protein [Nonlabens sp. YIK11]
MHRAEATKNNDLYSLSVLIHQDGLSFYTHNSATVQEAVHKSFKYPANPIELLEAIQESFEKEALLEDEFKEVTLIYHHNIYAAVPAALFEEEHAADYLKYNTKLLQTDTISIDEPVDNLGSQLVYIAYSNISNYFFDTYGDHAYYHYATRSLEVISRMSSGIYLEIMPSHFYVTAIDKNHLVAHNIFPYEQIEDILYYTLFALEQNKLDPETIPLTIIQEQQDAQLFDLLYTYVRNVAFIEDYQSYLNNIICA